MMNLQGTCTLLNRYWHGLRQNLLGSSSQLCMNQSRWTDLCLRSIYLLDMLYRLNYLCCLC